MLIFLILPLINNMAGRNRFLFSVVIRLILYEHSYLFYVFFSCVCFYETLRMHVLGKWQSGKKKEEKILPIKLVSDWAQKNGHF